MSTDVVEKLPPGLSLRRPTGRAGYPKVLLGGTDKSGKGWEAALASGVEWIGRTIWINFGERSPDEYGAIPGVNFEVVEPRTRGDLRATVREVVTWKWVAPDRPTLIILDSATALWELITAEAQAAANAQARKKAQDAGKPFDPLGDYDITMNLWNDAKDRWYEVIGPLLRYKGPVLFTGRLDEVTAMNDRGQPNARVPKEWKVAAHKRFVYDMDVIVQFRGPFGADQKRMLTGVRSVAMGLAAATVDLTKVEAVDARFGFTQLMGKMGVTPATVDTTVGFSLPVKEGEPQVDPDDVAAAVANDDMDAIRALWKRYANDPPSLDLLKPAGDAIMKNLAALAAAEEAPPASDAVMHHNVREAVRPDVVDAAPDPAPEPAPDDSGPGPEPEQRIVKLTPEEAQAMALCRKRIDFAVNKYNDGANLDRRAIQAAIRQAKSQGWVEVETFGLQILRENPA